MTLDKITHFLVGAVIALALGYLLPIAYGLLAAVLAGALKELYDHCRPDTRTVDVMDFVATLIFIELPREFTVSARLTRHSESTGWRQRVAVAIRTALLDNIDPAGVHHG